MRHKPTIQRRIQHTSIASVFLQHTSIVFNWQHTSVIHFEHGPTIINHRTIVRIPYMESTKKDFYKQAKNQFYDRSTNRTTFQSQNR